MKQVENCTAVILAGGESRRMGADKASTLLAGKPLLAHVLEQLKPLFSDVLISVRELRSDMGYTQIIDDAPDRGPMIGIQSALQAVQTDWLFVIACDMPFVSAQLIQALAAFREHHDAVLVHAYDRPQPLMGFYKQTCLPLMQARIRQGKRSMIRLLDELDVYWLTEEQAKVIDPRLNSLMSLDRPEDVQRMEQYDE